MARRATDIAPIGIVPRGLDTDLYAFLTAVKSDLDLSRGRTGSALDRTVTFRDLQPLGVNDPIFNQARPSSTRITRITADAVRTGKLESSDSSTYFDLDYDKLVMGGKASYGSAIAGIFLGRDGYALGVATYKINIGYDATNYLKFDGSKILIKAANFELNSSGQIVASGGTIANWDIQSNLLRSAASGVRMELNQEKARISIFDAVNEKVAMGYLAGLPKNDGTGDWDVGDYGFWARDGDKLRIDGDGEYINGDWIVKHDAAYLIQDSEDRTIVRLGTDTGEKGLFIYDTAGVKLAQYVSTGFLIGDVTKAGNYIEYVKSSGALTVKGAILVTGGTPDGAGLYLTADYMGYWNGSAWRVYVKNDGNFYAGDGANEFMGYVPGTGLSISTAAAAALTVKSGGNVLVKDAAENSIIRLGTEGALKGLFVYDTSAVLLAQYTGSGFLIGDVTKAGSYIEYVRSTGALTVVGSITVTGGSWSHASDATKIDGGDIYTNSITAASIAALTITAAEIAAGTITADKMSVTDLSAIAANIGTITAGLAKSSDGKIQLDLDNKWLKVWDASSVLRVHLGYIP